LKLPCLSSCPNDLFLWNQFSITVCFSSATECHIVFSKHLVQLQKCHFPSPHLSQLTVSDKHYTVFTTLHAELFSEFSFSKNAHQLRIGVILKGSNTEGIIIIFNLRTAAFKAYCAIWVRRSKFCHQASPHVSPCESTQWRKAELWARNVR